VQLLWSPGSTRATKGYLVERKFQGDAAYTALTPAPITTAAFTDHLPPGKEQVTPSYRVVAVDKRNRTGDPALIPAAVISAPGMPEQF
jgi:hypothetical protein